MTLALGIDPGTATTGYGLVRLEEDGSLVAVKFGVILTPKDASAPARLEMLYDELRELLSLHHPDTAAVEKLFFQRNVSTAIAVGQARGVVMLALQQAHIEPFEYTPNEVKQAVAATPKFKTTFPNCWPDSKYSCALATSVKGKTLSTMPLSFPA